jgi:hypothetical protein
MSSPGEEQQVSPQRTERHHLVEGADQQGHRATQSGPEKIMTGLPFDPPGTEEDKKGDE